jgi:hypothetical protein
MGAYVLQLRKALSHSYLRDFTDCARATATGSRLRSARALEAVCGDVQTLPGILLSFAIMATGRETIVMSMMWLPRDGFIALGAC